MEREYSEAKADLRADSRLGSSGEHFDADESAPRQTSVRTLASAGRDGRVRCQDARRTQEPPIGADRRRPDDRCAPATVRATRLLRRAAALAGILWGMARGPRTVRARRLAARLQHAVDA